MRPSTLARLSIRIATYHFEILARRLLTEKSAFRMRTSRGTLYAAVFLSRTTMLDTIFFIGTVVFFLVAVAYVWGCEKL